MAGGKKDGKRRLKLKAKRRERKERQRLPGVVGDASRADANREEDVDEEDIAEEGAQAFVDEVREEGSREIPPTSFPPQDTTRDTSHEVQDERVVSPLPSMDAPHRFQESEPSLPEAVSEVEREEEEPSFSDPEASRDQGVSSRKCPVCKSERDRIRFDVFDATGKLRRRKVMILPCNNGDYFKADFLA